MLKLPLSLHSAHAWRGLRIGLLGGSFNPPHEGHLHISRIALRMLKLDAIWWLVSPQNPLKNRADYAPLTTRLKACDVMLRHEPRMLATDIEDHLGTNRSYDTITALQSRFQATDFIFLIGADSAHNFHKWYRWRDIPALAPLGILARPPATIQAQNCPLRMDRHIRYITLSRAETVPLTPSTCIWMKQHPLASQSSTNVRKHK